MPTWVRWAIVIVVLYVLWVKFGSRFVAKG